MIRANEDLSVYSQASAAMVLTKLETRITGLSRAERRVRRGVFGLNVTVEQKNSHILLAFVNAFRSPLTLILLVVSVITFILGENVNAIIIVLMVIISTLMNFFQEYRASRAAAALIGQVAHKVSVIEHGKEVDIPAAKLVPGDIVSLNAGDMVPADCRVIAANDLFVNQSSLTGESFPVEKHDGVLTGKPGSLTDYTNMVFAGTNVVSGTGRAVVCRSGRHTEFGTIVKALDEGERENEFTRGISAFSSMILRIILVFVICIFLSNAFIKQDILQSLLFSIAVAVGLTPEFLPTVMSVTMGLGSVAMAKKGVIVKRLVAIPTFGSMDTLCTDKTGTLTEDRIRLVKYLDLEGKPSEMVYEHAYLNSTYQTGITNPMDEAILSYERRSTAGYRKIDEIPFDFQRKRMSVVVEYKGKRMIISKGAPENVLAVSTSVVHSGVVGLNAERKVKLLGLYDRLSREGYRVLAVASGDIGRKDRYTKDDEKDLTVVGLMAFLDPAKQGVREAIDRLEAMGIEVKVITGDNELVTEKICRDSDIEVRGVIFGQDTEKLSERELFEKAKQTTIFARCSPAQKSRIISSLRKHGRVVGYLGDGINDAPALVGSDVGISVSNAVDVAKESADIILTHKSLGELADGVMEGRKTFGNTMKYIMMGLSSNFGNMFSVVGAVLVLPFLPMLPIQILLNNFLYDLGQLTLPFDNVDEEYILKPHRWDMGFIKKFMLILGPVSSIFDFIAFGVLYVLFAGDASKFQTGWFMVSLATQVFVIHVIRTRMIPITESRSSALLVVSTIASVIVGWVIPYTTLGGYFEFTGLSLYTLFILAGIVACYLVTAEFAKRWFYLRMVKS